MKRSIMASFFALACMYGYANSDAATGQYFDMERQGYENLFLAPGLDQLRIECDMTRTIYIPSPSARNILEEGGASGFGPNTREHFDESWLRQQLETRSQTYHQTLSVDDGVWVREVIAEAGPLFQHDQHVLNIIDFNTMERIAHVLSHPDPDTSIITMPLTDDSYYSIRLRALTGLTFGEILGRSEALPIFLEGTGATPQLDSDGPTRVTRYKNSEDGWFVAELEEDAQGRLLSAIYWENPRPTIRELTYGKYVTDPQTGIEYPSEVNMKRYIRTRIDERSPERLTEEVTVRITGFSATP